MRASSGSARGGRWSAAGRWAVFAAYLGLTVFLSSQSQVPGADSVPDFLLHIPEFAVLALLLLWAWSGRFLGPHSPRALVGSLVFGVGYGVVDEIHQWFVPGRHSSVKDALVDAGATLATVGTMAWLSRRSGGVVARSGTSGGIAPAAGSAPASSIDPDRAEDRDAGQAAARDGKDGPIEIVLFTRRGCHLCLDTESLLLEVLGPEGAAWSRIDIDTDPVLAERYGLEVPVLLMDGIKRFKGRIERSRLERLLEDRPRLRRSVLP